MPTPSSRIKTRNSPGTAIPESTITTTTHNNDTMSSPSTSHKKRTHTLSNIFKRLSDHSSQDSGSMVAPLSPSTPLGPFSSPSQRSSKSLRKSLSMRISRSSNDHVNDAVEAGGKGNGNGNGSGAMAKSTSVPNRLSDRRTFTLNGQPLDLSQMPQLPPVQPLKAPKTKRQELEHVRRKLVGGLHSGNSGSRSRHFDDDDDDDNSEIYDEEDEDEMSITKDTNGDEIPQKTRLYLANDNLDTASPSSSGQQNGHHGIFNSNRLGKTLSKKHISKTSLRMQSSTPNQSMSSVTNHNDGEPIEYNDKVEEVEGHSTERSGLFSTLMNTFNLRSFTDLTNHGTNNHVDDATDQEETDDDDKSTYDDEDHNNDQKSKEVSLSSSQQQATNDVLSKVSFVPLKKPLISTIGQGNLTLDSFPKNQTQLPSDDGMSKITMHEAPNAQQTILRANTLANGHSPLIDDKLSSFSPPNITLEQPTANRSSISSDEIGHAIATTNFKSPTTRLSKPRRSLSPGSRRGTIRSSLTSILSSDDDANANGNGNGNGTPGELSSIPMTNSLSFKRKLKIPLAGKRISLDLPIPCTTTNDENVNETPVSFSKRRDVLFEKLNIKPPSDKRQESFHNLFPNLPMDETIIEDFTCAFRKEILVQGKLYLTEHYICFHSNIIGLVTRFAIPLNAILKMQKKKTVGIPNAIEFSNLHNKYIFASFLSRDQTYDLIHKVWKMNIRKDGFDVIDLDIDDNEVDSMDSGSIISTDDEDNVIDDKNNASVNHTLGPDDDADTSDTSISDQENMVKDGETEGVNADDADNAVNDAQIFNGFTFEGPKTHATTSNGYTAESSDIKITDEIIKAPLGVVYGLLFGDDISFVKNLLKAQKNYDIGDIPKFNAKKRVYTYTKPINGGPVGPKQTKCIVEEEIQHKDFESYCLVQQLTESPDVPSGNSFKVKTKIYLSWAPNNATKLFVITSFVWTGKSWIKGAIEKGGISGQKEALGIMVSELKKRILAGGSAQGGAVGSIKRKGKKNREGKDENAEAADESQTLEEEEPEVIPEVPKTFMDLVMDQLDLKLVLIVLLFILVVSDKFSRHKKPSGYELYSSDRMLMSESNLWEWIEQREHVLPRCIPGESQECSAMSKLTAKKHRESIRSSAKRKISQQNLKSTIDLMEQELAALKAKAGGYEALL